MKKNICILTLIIAFTQLATAQSPWTKEKGKAYIQLGFSGIFYNQAQIDGKKVDLNADYSDITLQVYSEYGITNKLEAQLVLPYKTVSFDAASSNVSESFSGIGNITVGLKYKLYDNKWKISSGLQYSPKTSQYDEASGLSTGFNASTFVPYISAGSSKGKWYYFGNVGYGYMDNDYSDYFKFSAEVGYNIIPKGHIMLFLDTRNIVSKEDAFVDDTKQWTSYLDRQTYNTFGVKLNYEFTNDKFGANAAVLGAMGIDNAPLAPSINFGVYAKI